MSEHQEINDVTPTSLSHIIGQRSVVEQVKVAVEAAFADGKKFDHALLVGPPGVGNTALAQVIAEEMAVEFNEALGQSIKNAGDLNALLLAAKDKSVLHLDEAHELKKEYQTALYRAIEGRKLFIQGRSSIQTILLADFTLLLSTTCCNWCREVCQWRARRHWRRNCGQEGAHLEPLKVKPVRPGLSGFRLLGIRPTPAAVPSEHDVRRSRTHNHVPHCRWSLFTSRVFVAMIPIV